MNIRYILYLFLFVSLQVSAKAPKLAEKFGQDSTIILLTDHPKTEIRQGDTVSFTLTVKQHGEWHTYSSKMSPDLGPEPLTISFLGTTANAFKLISIKELGKVKEKYDSTLEGVTKSLYGTFDVIVKAKVLAKAPLGKVPVSLGFHYTVCNESFCLPPRTFAVPMTFLGQKEINVTIAEAKAPIAEDTVEPPVPTPIVESVKRTDTVQTAVTNNEDFLAVADRSIWEFILLTVGFGLLALLTPCVFPMIPITVSFFTKRNQESRHEAVIDATFYGVGIIVTFVGLGFLMALLFGTTGINRLASNPIANAIIAGVFITFALNLFGLFEIGLPPSLLTKLNMKATSHSNKRLSVIMMGFVFSLTSFTCTVPIVGTLMVAFNRGDWMIPLIGMTVFATVFALPFFLLALFPRALKTLPKSGGWLNSVKVVMGFLEMAAALKFISNIDLVLKWGIFTRDLVIAAWAAIFIITTLYLLGRFNLPHDTPSQHIGPLRAVFAVFFATIGIYMFTGFGGRPLGELDGLLPPAENGLVAASVPAARGTSAAASHSEELKWHPRFSSALEEAKATGKNIFVDFTGYTCVNCRAMEAQVFSRKDVQNIFKDFVLARLYTDDGSPLNDSNQYMEESRFNTIALPYYAIITPDDKAIGTFPGYTRNTQEFIDFLNKNKSQSSQLTDSSPAD